MASSASSGSCCFEVDSEMVHPQRNQQYSEEKTSLEVCVCFQVGDSILVTKATEKYFSFFFYTKKKHIHS